MHAGKVGAGHFSKMVHNGIEYAMMQAYAEGWELLQAVDLVDNVTDVFDSWREGTVIRSWLLDLLVAAIKDDTHLEKIRGYAEDSGEGRWTVQAAIDNAVAMHVIAASLFARFSSRQDDSPAMKAIAAMRNQFGGHAVQARVGRRPPPTSTSPQPTGRAARSLADGSRRRLYVAHLSLHDFRSYPVLEVELEPGVTSFVGRNGQGKTNIVEAIDYLSRLALAPGGRGPAAGAAGADQAVVRAAVVRDGRTAVLEIEINPGKSNRARVNRAQLPRARELLGMVRTVLFAPDDLALVKGDPTERRRFLDDLLVLRDGARYAGIRGDYDRVLKQRNTLLKTARSRAVGCRGSAVDTGGVGRQARPLGAEILAARLRLVEELNPCWARPTRQWRAGPREDARSTYRPSFDLTSRWLRSGANQRVSKPGPSRTWRAPSLAELETPAHGRARARRLPGRPAPRRALLTLGGSAPGQGVRQPRGVVVVRAGDEAGLVRAAALDGDDPVLILDDVFAELDTSDGPSSPSWSPAPSRCWSPQRCPRTSPLALRGRALRRGRRGGDARCLTRHRTTRPDEGHRARRTATTLDSARKAAGVRARATAPRRKTAGAAVADRPEVPRARTPTTAIRSCSTSAWAA